MKKQYLDDPFFAAWKQAPGDVPSEIIPRGKHKGKSVRSLTQMQFSGLFGGWNSVPRLKAHPFFSVIEKERDRRTPVKSTPEATKSFAAEVSHSDRCEEQGCTSLVYLSGPMSNLPDHNFPAFNAWAYFLRARGYDVVNPAEINSESGEWCDCLRADIRAMMDCDTLAYLPGWETSRGAMLEIEIAHRVGMRIAAVEKLIES